MLIYDGLHYDSLAVAAFEGAPEDLDITVLQVGAAGCFMHVRSVLGLLPIIGCETCGLHQLLCCFEC